MVRPFHIFAYDFISSCHLLILHVTIAVSTRKPAQNRYFWSYFSGNCGKFTFFCRLSAFMTSQFACHDFCAGKRYQNVVRARVEAAKVALRMEFSQTYVAFAAGTRQPGNIVL